MSHSGGQNGSNPMGSVERVQGGQLGATSEISGPQGADGPAGAAASTEVVGTEAASGAEATSGVVGAAELDGAHGVDGTAAITEALQAGEINAESARTTLIEQAIAAHLPPDADPAVVDELRAELSAALADDPTLAGLLS
ncbi:MAG: hypothetical protein JKY37_10980 [Nannocystaceae bacterium]|nr:hypothetical protein [Nannocystaceae bacterium]